jgi:predicted porin
MKYLFPIAFLLLTSILSSQNFFGSAVVGTNISQIDGDDAAGFDRYNLSAGIKIDYPIKPAVDLSIEFLYSGRGSKNTRRNIDINLDYIELPFMISFRDWYIEKDKYDKVRADAGVSYGYLFQAGSNDKFSKYIQDLKKHDVSFIIGATYMFTKHVGLSARYTRSFYKVLINPKLESGGFLSYFTTVRMEYHF